MRHRNKRLTPHATQHTAHTHTRTYTHGSVYTIDRDSLADAVALFLLRPEQLARVIIIFRVVGDLEVACSCACEAVGEEMSGKQVGCARALQTMRGPGLYGAIGEAQ